MITLITATGHRPESFALCCKYMQRQTVNTPIQWIVIDDSIGTGGKCDSAELLKNFSNPGNIKAELYAGPQLWRPGVNTQRGNLDIALSFVKGDKIFIIEDDDFYHPRYLQVMSALLDLVDIVGESNTKYYFLNGPGGKEHFNYMHSALCQTGFVKSQLSAFLAAVNSGNMYIDLAFWGEARKNHTPRLLVSERNLCIGIKGMPGRENLSAGAKQKDFLIDPTLAKLKEWIGEDVEFYKPYARNYGNEKGSSSSDEGGNERRQGINNRQQRKSAPGIQSSAGQDRKGGLQQKGSWRDTSEQDKKSQPFSKS